MSNPTNGIPLPTVALATEVLPSDVELGVRGANDPVDVAIAGALFRAAEAGRFDVVAQLARELEARRCARAGNVVRLEPTRRKEGDV
jgi:hypothetical protein